MKAPAKADSDNDHRCLVGRKRISEFNEYKYIYGLYLCPRQHQLLDNTCTTTASTQSNSPQHLESSEKNIDIWNY
jgi:hypothetical protein